VSADKAIKKLIEKNNNITLIESAFKDEGQVRQLVFNRAKNLDVDILIFPDSNEIFSKHLDELLIKFWNSKSRAIAMRPIKVLDDFQTISKIDKKREHRIFKYFNGLTAIPFNWGTKYLPLKDFEIMNDTYTLISILKEDDMPSDLDLWKAGKDVRDCNQHKIMYELEREPDLTLEDYVKGGKKRQPMGIENAAMALKDAINILERMGIYPYLLFGTALMLYRDGEFKKWEWDIDLGMKAEDLDKFNEKTAYYNGFDDIKIKRDLPRWKRKDGTESKNLRTRTISFKKHGCKIDIDILHLSEDETERLILKGRKREKFVSVAPKGWFDNPNKILYRDKEYLLPGNTEEYLKSQYGETWNIPQYLVMSWHKRAARMDYWEIKN